MGHNTPRELAGRMPARASKMLALPRSAVQQVSAKNAINATALRGLKPQDFRGIFVAIWEGDGYDVARVSDQPGILP